ncbi:MAG: DUF2101 family protein [Candidatus Hydrothermarchaeales archaeon]
MGLLEDLGEAALRVLNKVVYYIIGVLIKLIEFLKRVNQVLQRPVIYSILQKRGIELRDYMVLKVQAVVLAFLILVVLFIFDFLTSIPFAVLGVLLVVYSLLLTFSLKEYFEEFEAYRDFFLSYLGISILLVLVKRVKPTLDFAFPYIHLVVISLVYIALFSTFFKKRYARDYTYGKVIAGGDPMTVKVNYDICASVKPGVLLFKNDVKAGEGDVVKLGVEKSFLNLRGSSATQVLGLKEGKKHEKG